MARVARPVALLWVVLCVALAVPAPLVAQTEEAERVAVSTRLLAEIMDAPDAAIPGAVLERAEAVAVFPSTLKAGFIFGGHRGRGVISASREGTGGWSVPAFLTLTGGSFGLQIGGQSVDVVLVIMNRLGLEKLLQSEFKIGGDASAVVGPLGRDLEASTDILAPGRDSQLLAHPWTLCRRESRGLDDPGRYRRQRAILRRCARFPGDRARPESWSAARCRRRLCAASGVGGIRAVNVATVGARSEIRLRAPSCPQGRSRSPR